MLSSIVLYSFIGLIVALAIAEVRRYRALRDEPDTLAYTRRRLARRLGVAALILGALLGTFLRPGAFGPYRSLAWYSACFAAIALAVIISLRDLSETSRAVVREHRRFQEEMKKELDEAKRKAKQNSRT
jgi:hypothetical protein